MRVLAVASLIALSSAATVDLVKRKGGGGGGHGGGGHSSSSGHSSGSSSGHGSSSSSGQSSSSPKSGSGGGVGVAGGGVGVVALSSSTISNKSYKGSTDTQGGTFDTIPAAAGGASYTYVAGECYDEALNPVTYYASNKQAWIQNNQTSTNWGGSNAGQNNVNSKYTHTNWYFDIYDAYFNGSVSLKLDPPSGASCLGVETQAIPYSYFRIGQMSRSGGQYSRKDYDNNPFYFRLGRFTASGYSCQITPRKMFSSLESSNNGYNDLQVWTVSSKLNGDSYDISGTLTSTTASVNNYFNVLPFASSNTTNDPGCPSHFSSASLNKDNKVTMNGTVSATTANINWYFTDTETGWAVTGTFNGSAWNDGAKLDFTTSPSVPVTTGEAKRVECTDCSSDDDESYVEKHETSIIAGSVIGGVVFLAVVGVVGFFIMQWWKKRQYTAAKQVDHDDAWAMEDHHHERELKDGASTGLKPIPSQQNLMPGHGVDTSYDAHRSPSPDPTTQGLPAYSEQYTPLK